MNTKFTTQNSTIIILCTLPNDQDFAFKLIKNLLNLKLAACVTLLEKAQSFYYWNDKLETCTELQLFIKTKQSLEKSVLYRIKELHPYQTPELLVLPVISGEPSYLQWIKTTLSSDIY